MNIFLQEPSAAKSSRGTPLTVEVVLCSYNGSRFISEQLQSILDQSRPVDLISIYDDGSTDDTVAIIQAVADVSPVVRVQTNSCNLGYAQNFASAVANATGDILFFSDQDDIWMPDKVHRLLKLMEDSECAMVFSDGILIDEEGSQLGHHTVLDSYGLSQSGRRHFSEQALRLLMCRNYINGAAMAVRRLAAQAALPVPKTFPHDYWFALCLCRKGGIELDDRPLFKYRQHGGNLIGIDRSTRLGQLLGIWRNPLPPRVLALRRSEELLERLEMDDERRPIVEAKLYWLYRVLTTPGRWRRLSAIFKALCFGDYTQFGTPYSVTRDIVAALKDNRVMPNLTVVTSSTHLPEGER